MANSKCCKYKVGSEIREYTPDRWSISSDFPTDNNLALHIITSPSKFADKTIRTVTDELLEDNDKENLCSLYYTITWLLDNITEYKNNTVARGILGEIDDHCEKCPKKDYKCKCVKKLGQEVYDINSKDCDEEFLWNDKKCKCVKEPKEEEDEGEVAPIEDEKVRGCMVNPKGLPDDVTVNYNPEATSNYGCEFTKTIELTNKFCFCTKDTCHETGGGSCITGTQKIESLSSSYESFKKKYERTYENAYDAIVAMGQPQTKISTEKGFYSPGGVTNPEVVDLAKALTILHFRGYSLNKSAKGKGSTQSDLVMYNENGEYLGFFKGTYLTAPRFGELTLQLTTPIIHLRLSQNVGGYVQDDHIDGLGSYLVNTPNNRGSYRYEDTKNITIGVDGLIGGLNESTSIVGLGSILETKIIGLGRLLK